jgi:hypothetical protein
MTHSHAVVLLGRAKGIVANHFRVQDTAAFQGRRNWGGCLGFSGLDGILL